MLFHVPLADLLTFAATLVGAGIVAGLLAGLFGIGGGAVLVPVLYQFQGLIGVDESIRMHVAVATSLGVIIPTSLRSLMAHRKRGAVDDAVLKSLLIPVPVGVVLGACLASSMSGTWLRAIFAVITALVAAKLLFAKASWRLGSDMPGTLGRSVVGLGIGLLSVMMGIGGGVLNNTFMTLYGRSMHQAVATSAGVGVLIAVPGMIGYMWGGWGEAGLPPLSIGYVNILAVLLIIPLTLLTAPLGVRLAHAFSRRTLEISFGLFSVLVSIRFIVSLL